MLKRVIIAIVLSIFVLGAANADVKLKIAVVNPSETKQQTTPVRFDLPKAITPEQIIDIGDMEMGYDFDKGNYYVYGKVTLKPGEKKIFEIRIEDIWTIPDKDITFLRNHTKTLLKKLKFTKHYRIGSALAKKIEEPLEEISKSQPKEVSLKASKKINVYYENVLRLNKIKEKVGMLENLVIDIGGVVEERVEIPETLAISVYGDEEAGPGDFVELTVKISNPSETKSRTADLKYVLPGEVTPAHVIDNSGLDMGYDFDKECFYVYKDNVLLEGGQTKSFLVKILDIWKIPNQDIEALRAHTNNLMLLLEDTEYYNQGKPIADKALSGLETIDETQSLKVSAGEHIAYYRDNTNSFEGAKKHVAQLEKIVTQSGASPGVTIAKAERLEGGGREVKRETGYEGIRLIAESIFRGKAPNIATTWKVIFTIIVFVGILGALFFGLWYVQVKKRGK